MTLEGCREGEGKGVPFSGRSVRVLTWRWALERGGWCSDTISMCILNVWVNDRTFWTQLSGRMATVLVCSCWRAVGVMHWQFVLLRSALTDWFHG